MLGRVRQFLIHISGTFKRLDDNYLVEHLDKEQLLLFLKLSKSDAQHSIRVAKAMEKHAPEELKHVYAGIGLFHDIGKTIRPLSVLEKVVLVLAHAVMKDDLRKLVRFKAVESYLGHGRSGAEILERRGIFYNTPWVRDVIRYHHNLPEHYSDDDEIDGMFNKAMVSLKLADNDN
jgi:putative nucleotidyltransferase with HDIG domain